MIIFNAMMEWGIVPGAAKTASYPTMARHSEDVA
jgi:hypothetical protein